MNRTELETELVQVGTESMHCERKYQGVRSSIEEGLSPRYVMISGSGDKINCIIVSIAPPRTAARDRKLLVAARGYEDMLEQCRGKVESTVFYAKLNAIRNKLGLGDSAVWTTLCKCERIKGEELPSETIQACAESHLVKELELVDKSVPIIAVGNRVFNAVRQSFPERFVLNVPSPDGPRGDFQKTADNKKLLEFAKARVAEGRPGALCHCPPCARRHLSADDA
jgi:hypothetical protein